MKMDLDYNNPFQDNLCYRKSKVNKYSVLNNTTSLRGRENEGENVTNSLTAYK